MKTIIKHSIHKAFTLPPHVTIKKSVGRIKQAASEMLLRYKDHKVSTYAAEYPKGTLLFYFSKVSSDHLLPQAEAIAGVTRHYLDHRFDLLGSGWVQVRHGMRCQGLEGYRYDMGKSIEVDAEGKWLHDRINTSNLITSQQIWKLILCNQLKIPQRNDLRIPRGRQNSKFKIDYLPIDWHLDFKSGYRWSESTWYKNIRYGHKLGVDVKVPWELARMQHLPQLAFAYKLSAQSLKLLGEMSSRFHSNTMGSIYGAGGASKAQKEEGKTGCSSWLMAHGNKEESKNQTEQSLPRVHWEKPERYAQEFRSQVLDFIAANPPGFGVNWSCTMDVGIRVANWLVAYVLFCAYKAKFDREFLDVFKRSVYEHGLHIINNLEWNEELRSNHYLSDIAGLLFVAAYLPCSPEIDGWLAFAVQELINEVESQFYPDGGNFEASTSYHRLSAEIALYAGALVLGLRKEKVNALRDYDHTLIKVKPGLRKSPLPFYNLPIRENSKLKTQNSKLTSPFPGWYFERLEKMAEFTMHITKQNNHIPQIGDNDSGRFLKLQPVYQKMTVAEAKKRYLNLEGYEELPGDALYWDEDFLDHRHLVAAINGLYDRGDFSEFVGSNFYETEIVNNLVKGMTLMSYKKSEDTRAAENVRIGSEQDIGTILADLDACPTDHRQVYEFPIPGDGLLDGLKLYAYPDFGLYIYHSKRLYLAVRCGPINQNGSGGHAHNDQLSIELNVDGKDWIVDPGTYLYTPLPESRNKYRSVKSHFAPNVDNKEPRAINCSLFQLNVGGGKCLYFESNGFVGRYRAYSDEIIFIVTLEQNIGLRIYTVNQNNQSLSFPHQYPFTLDDGVYVFESVGSCPPGWSPAYGKETACYSRVQV